MKKVKIGLIGCGRISDKHFESIANIPEAEVIACCDIIANRAKDASEKYSVANYYTDYLDLINKEKLDLVTICTPSGIHPKIGIAAAKKKINVLSEKPMAVNVKDADALIQACDQNKVELFVVKQNRLNPTVQLLKKAIESNRFGKIYMIQSNVFWQRPQSYYDMAKWRGTWEFDGGAYMNQASHYVDLVQWLIGPVDSVLAETATMERKIEAEDSGAAILKFRNGTIGTINVSMLTFPKNFEGSVTVLGEKGTVKLAGVALNKIEKWEFEDYSDDDKFIEQCNYTPPNIYGLGHQPYYENVINSLLGKEDAKTDGRSGRKSLEIIEAIYLSARDGKKVPLPLR